MSDLKAGYELDALVAEKVMGLHGDDKDSACYVDRHDIDQSYCYECCKSCSENESVYLRYSTGISAVWEVVEKIKQKTCGGLLIIEREKDTLVAWAPFDAQWEETTRNPMTMRISLVSYVEAAETPLAICLAALKVFGYYEMETGS